LVIQWSGWQLAYRELLERFTRHLEGFFVSHFETLLQHQ
jgi:hypothetical protein